MKQKKKTPFLAKPKKKSQRKTLPKTKKQFSKKLLIGIGLLFIALFVIVAASSQQQSLLGDAQTVVSPTFGSIGDCHANNTCPTGSTIITGSPIVSLQPTTIIVPSTSVISSAPAQNPCTTSSVSIMSKRHGNAGNQGFFQMILQLLQLLLQFFQQLLGGNTTPIPVNPSPQPTLGTQPTPISNPTQAPCPSQPATSVVPSSSPTGSAAPTVTTAPVPTGSTAIQPAASYARPGGGQWHLAFHDEFDGTGGTSADAMSGANFVNKTVGGGALPGNPGLNPRKWNMGWQTGPSTLDGLGMVTTSTTGMCPNGCTENDWYGVGSLVFPGDGALHMRSQNKSGTATNFERNTTSTSNNEEGMITTAGLLAVNPANSSHGSVPADRFVDGPIMLEWKATNIFVVDWPAFWMANGGYFGHVGSQWPGGTSFQEEIDLLEPIFRMHQASEFQQGLSDIPAGWNQNATLTFTWYFDPTHIIMWVTDASGKQVKQINLPNSQVTASMISAQWRLPQYLFIQQKTQKSTANYGDMTLDYVRIWN